MKTLLDYMVESERQYVYRIKVAGDLTTETFDRFKASLGMFDVAECTKPKKTPIQEDPFGFPGVHNEEIHIFDATLNYPANEEQIRALADRCGIEQNKIVITLKEFDESMNAEMAGLEDGTRLDTPEYPEPTKEQKKASDDYADSYQDAAKEFANDAQTDFEVAGGAAPKAEFLTDKEEGKDSPMSKIKVPNYRKK